MSGVCSATLGEMWCTRTEGHVGSHGHEIMPGVVVAPFPNTEAIVTPEAKAILMIRGAIAELPPETQSDLAAILQAISELRKTYGEEAFQFAIKYFGALLAGGK